MDNRQIEIPQEIPPRTPQEFPQRKPRVADKPISNIYPVIDTDIARDNIENDIPAADLEDL